MITEILIVFIGLSFFVIAIIGIAYLLQKVFESRFNKVAIDADSKINRESFSEISRKLQNQGILAEVDNVLYISETKDLIVKLSHFEGSQNVFRFNANDSITWYAELPEEPKDIYVKVEWNKQQLVAYSWSGYRVVLDLDTGKIVTKVFTK